MEEEQQSTCAQINQREDVLTEKSKVKEQCQTEQLFRGRDEVFPLSASTEPDVRSAVEGQPFSLPRAPQSPQ